jgi:hypothetical protein
MNGKLSFVDKAFIAAAVVFMLHRNMRYPEPRG